MNRTLLFALAALAAMLPVQPASANHGAAVTYLASTGTCTLLIAGAYDSGDGDAQTWNFALSKAGDCGALVDVCTGVGSIESGFTKDVCNSGDPAWSVAGTGDPHAFPNPVPDTHAVDVTIDGTTLSGTAVVLG